MKSLPIDLHDETTEDATAKAVLKTTRETTDAINAVATEFGTDSTYLAEVALPKVERTLQNLDAALEKLKTAEEHLHTQVDKKFEPDRNDPALDHIVAHWRGQKSPATKLINADRRTLSVVLSMPAYVLGITDEEQQTLRDHALERLEPEIATQLQVNRKAVAKVERAGVWFGQNMADLIRTSAQKASARKAAKEKLK